ncbi:hypothetical protein WJX72_000938 [[Myrmecia] bisecta]|uniref:Complex 1 LYR protein domain-containing protein n=1 Tax=[Myrmecia] bisecta TaxID=41462 RepID=A0AAW1QE45_9CHLO
MVIVDILCVLVLRLSTIAGVCADKGDDIHLGATDADVADVIDRSLDKTSQRPQATPQQLLTTRREALSLYREILRYSLLFVWLDERGQPWRDVIRASARQEFEAARFEREPELVNRLIISGRDSVQRTMEKFMARRQQVIEEEAKLPPEQRGMPHPP